MNINSIEEIKGVWFQMKVLDIEKCAKEDGNSKQLAVVMAVKNFIMKHTYKRKNADVVMPLLGLPDSKIRDITKLKDSNIRNIESAVSVELYEMFGSDFLLLLAIGDEDSLRRCKYQLSVVSSGKGSYNYFPLEFISIINSNSIEVDYDLEDCKAEYAFLKDFSLTYFKGRLSTLDINKVNYLLRILDKKAGSPEDTFGFMRKLDELEVIRDEIG